MSRLVTVSFVLLVLLIGCVGTDSPGPEANATTSESGFAPGVSTVTVTDPPALLAAHRQAMLSDGARISLERSTTAVNGTLVKQATQTRSDGRTEHVTFAVERIGVTPHPPGWLDDIPAGTTLDVSLTIDTTDGRRISIRNDGPDDIPVGTTIAVMAENVSATRVLDVPLRVRETRWVWIEGSTGAFRLGTDRPQQAAAKPFGSRVVVEIRSADGVRLATADIRWRTTTQT